MERLAVMGRQSRAQGQRVSAGFTLIEVMIAIVVLSIASLGAASTVIGVINGNNVSKRVAVATMLAQAKIEDLKNLQYMNTDLTVGTHPVPPETVTVTGGGSYTRWWTVTDLIGVVMKTVAVCVRWKGTASTAQCINDGALHTVVVTTSRAQ
jgi:prepilin-type N-terminal cleavage/methylation domain-containing protein